MPLPKKPAPSRRRVPTTLKPLARAVRPVLEGLESRQLYSGTLTLVNPDLLPASDRLIFNTIGNPNTYAVANVVHSQQALTLRNTAATPLTIQSVTASGPFTVVNPPAAGTVIAAGSSLSVTVEFTQSSVPAHSDNQTNETTSAGLGAEVGGAAIGGSLTISSSDTATPTKVVALAGYYQQVSNNNEEPSLQTIVNGLAGYDTNLGLAAGQVDFTQGATTPTLYGNEVDADSWESANPAASVSVQQLAAFHTQGNNATLFWYPATSSSTVHELVQSTPAQGQTVLPTTTDTGSTVLVSTFSPGGAFGLRVDNEYSSDALNVADGNSNGGGHHFRFFPLVDENGNAVPNTYVVGMDYEKSQTPNDDFQDNVYVVSNIRPSMTPDTVTNLMVTAGASPTLTWTPSNYPSASYRVYRSSTLDGTYALLTPTPVTATSYTDATLTTATTAYYQVRAVDVTQSPEAQSAPATVTANPGPVAASYAFGTTAGTAVTVDVVANDTDATGTIVPSTVLVSTPPADGTAVNNGDGTITYTPAASFTGTDTLQYTVADTTGARSAPGTVTFTVTSATTSTGAGPTTPTTTPIPTPTTTPTTTPTLNSLVAQTLVNTATTLSVLATQTSDVTFAAASPVALSTQPTHGTATANADGTVTYTPSGSFVGGDSFTYKATSAAGVTSAAVTVDVNVGVAIGTGQKFAALTFTDEDKTVVTVALNKGVADVFFDGTGLYSAPTKGKTLLVSGTATNLLHIRTMTLTGTTAASTLSIKGAGNGAVTFGGVVDAGTLGTLSAKTSNLVTNGGASLPITGNALPAGYINLAGVRSVQLGSATNGTVDLGTAGVTSTAVAFAGTVAGTALTSAAPLSKVSAAKWIASSGTTPGPITAPSLASLAVPGEFDADLALSAAVGRTAALGTARVGSVTNGTWAITGNAKSITMASATSGFGGVTVGGTLTSMTVSTGNLSADVTAGAIGTLKVAGTLTGNVHTSGGLNNLTVGGLSGSSVTVGTVASLNNVTASTIGTSTLGTLRVTGGGTMPVFSGSTVIAHTINSATTGRVNAATAGAGIAAAAGSFRSAAVNVNGAAVRLNAAALASESALTAYLKGKGSTLGSFVIDIV